MKRKKRLAQHEEAVRARASSKQLTDAKAAAKLRRAAEAYYQRNLKLFADDRHGRDVVENDYFNLKSIVSDIRRGDLVSTYRHAGHLDTLVRETIPLDVWMHIGGRGLHE